VAPIATGRAVARRTIEALRTFRPDVLHLHEPLSPGPNHAALVGTTIPAVGTFHSARAGRNGWYETFRPGLKPMMRRLAVSTAVSDDAMRQVTLTFGGACEILPNGVDVPSLAHGPATPSAAPAIVFVGRHEQRKGLAVLLDAFAGLERDADLWVIGDGPEGSILRARGIPRVHWLGRVAEDEKQARLRGATIACFPAVEGESFGVVLLEAMAARTALVASDIDGYRTVSRADREALLVPPGDVSRLRDALRALLDDPARRAALVAEGARRADEFSMEHLAERFLPLYERAIGADLSPIARTARSVPGGETGGAGSRR
jgi:phosphatidylinositol alpha-mannosyltransferase